MTFQQFFDQYNGQGVDFDGFYGDQCVDLVQYYNRDVVGGPVLTGNAADIWTTYPPAYYSRVANTPTGVPQLGDIVIWDGSLNGGPGHIAVFEQGDANGFTSFDQNWPVGSLCHFQSHDYTKVLGWLHPTPPPTDTDLAACLQQHTILVDQCNQKDKEIASLKQTVDNLNSQIAKQNADAGTHEAQLTALQAQVDSLSPQVKTLPALQAQLTQAEQDRADALAAQTTQNRTIAQLRNSSYTTATSSVLLNELLTRFVNKLTRR